MEPYKVNKIKFNRNEKLYIQEAIEMLDLYSDTLSYHNLHTDYIVEKILDGIYERTVNNTPLHISEPSLVCLLTFIDTLNCFLIETKTEPFTESEYLFFKNSTSFFTKYNKYNNLKTTWKDYKKYINKQPVYVK